MAIASVAACGDNSKRCGDGTEANADGYCVPVDTTTCGPGTTLAGDECVPDGSVICEQGTVFDADLGGCVPSDEVCAEGTVFVDGECVPEDDTLTADLEEAPEPNDGALEDDDIAGQFALPAVGSSTTLHGCVTPYRDVDSNGNPDADFDLWIFQASGPSLIEVTADGVGGLTAGFQMISATGNAAIDGTWVRFGLNLTGDTSRRQVYLPEAGVYGLFMADGRSLFLEDGAVGGEETCYFTTIANVAIPAPTAISGNTDVAGMVGNDTLFFSADPVDGSFFIGVETLDAAAAAGSLLALKNDAAFAYDAAAPTSVVRTGGLADADEVLYVVEPVYNYALNPVPFTLRVNAPVVGALPTDGSTVTVTNGDLDDLVAWFDVDDDEMVHFDISSDETVDLIFIDDQGFLVSAQGTDFADWVKFPYAGRFHVVISTDATDPATYDVASTVTKSAITPLTIGTPVEDAAFDALGSRWHSLDLNAAAVWLAFNAGATGFGGDAVVLLYDLLSVGVPLGDFGPVTGWGFDTAGGDTAGRVVFGEGVDFLIQVFDEDGSADETATYDLGVANRDFQNFGLINEGTPIDQDDLAIAEDEIKYFFVRGSPGDEMTITITPTAADLLLETLDRDESAIDTADVGLDGDAETLTFVVGPQGWVAFLVYSFGTGDDTYDLDISVVSPVPYDVADGALTYTDVCASGEELTQTPIGFFGLEGDEAVTDEQTLPFAFNLFGTATPSSFWVYTNGLLAFQEPDDSLFNAAFFSNLAMPTAGVPDGVVAPYWDDLDAVTICKLEEADRVVIQWSGVVYGTSTAVQAQAVFNDDGTLELIYSGDHGADGGGATVGVESMTGLFATQVSFNEIGSVTAGSSKVLTPAP